MNKISRALAVALMAATIPATIVLAQQPTAGDQPAAEKSETRRGPSPETMARLEDGRIAFAKAALKLTPEQEKLWAPVEEKMRANFAERQKNREEWQAKRTERKAKGEEGKGEKLALPERIEKRSERMTKEAEKLNERAAKSKEFAEVLKPLYASFSEEQKDVASRVLSNFGEGKGGHKGPRCAMKGGFRGHGPHGDHGGPMAD
ncbi:Spy/CpxP family protein refolding chaperone [Hyphomicrobium sp. NDB2Meth4]|uniref:Spy/CpxP family protein refolding chaperone n=1 Tax=Hyphomicrobium sp. NDB2Meth4 TaxID=1892846 RepID=UPI000930E960|nr:Spy/CpxP family protein refolding chaperone [Hyphomicrobium sp. NDB2Meth4]